jgi:hypothetical protein
MRLEGINYPDPPPWGYTQELVYEKMREIVKRRDEELKRILLNAGFEVEDPEVLKNITIRKTAGDDLMVLVYADETKVVPIVEWRDSWSIYWDGPKLTLIYNEEKQKNVTFNPRLW